MLCRMPSRSWRRGLGRGEESAGCESVIRDVVEVEEPGNGGTGGRCRAGVEGA